MFEIDFLPMSDIVKTPNYRFLYQQIPKKVFYTNALLMRSLIVHRQMFHGLTSTFSIIQTLSSWGFHYRRKKTITIRILQNSVNIGRPIRSVIPTHHPALPFSPLSSLSPPTAVLSPLPESKETPNAIISTTHLVAASTHPTNTQLWRGKNRLLLWARCDFSRGGIESGVHFLVLVCL